MVMGAIHTNCDPAVLMVVGDETRGETSRWLPKRIEHRIASAPPKSLGGSPSHPYKLPGWPDGTGSN
jgi:hypothetical protein